MTTTPKVQNFRGRDNEYMVTIGTKLYFQRFDNTLAMIDDDNTVITDEYYKLAPNDVRAVLEFLYENACILSGIAVQEGIDEGFITFGNLN